MGHRRKGNTKKAKEKRRLRDEKRAARRLRGRSGSGSFSETGLVVERKRTTQEALRDIRVRERIPGSLEATARELSTNVALGTAGGRAKFRGSTFQLGSVGGGAARAGVAARLRGFVPSAKRIAIGAGVAGATAAAASIFNQLVPEGGVQVGHRDAGRSIATLPGVGSPLPPRNIVVKTWTTGTANFARLLDGRIAVQKKDGTIKTYRPQKHIVIPRNPRVGTLIRADKRLKRLVKGLKKVVK